MSRLTHQLKHLDKPLLIVSGLLILAGLAVQYAISLSEETMEIFYRQLAYAGIGSILFLVFASYNYHKLAKLNRWVYLALLGFLLYLLLFGNAIRGSARWIDLGFFLFQPAELAKIVVGVGLSRWLYLRRGQINHWKNYLLTFVYAAIPAGLILVEPDLGSAIIVMAVWGGLMLISPVKKLFIVLTLAVAVVFAGLGWQFVLKDYQKNRVMVFVDPNKDPRGQGYNVRQAMIAVGSGEFTGRGLGRGIQSQLKFLPERHTDFVFAATAEETGFIGSSAIVLLFFFLGRRLLSIMKSARDDLGMYITGAVLFLFLTQVTINVSMNIGLLPVTGIPLPFITYGGSSYLVMCIALGIVQNIARQSKTLRF